MKKKRKKKKRKWETGPAHLFVSKMYIRLPPAFSLQCTFFRAVSHLLTLTLSLPNYCPVAKPWSHLADVFGLVTTPTGRIVRGTVSSSPLGSGGPVRANPCQQTTLPLPPSPPSWNDQCRALCLLRA